MIKPTSCLMAILAAVLPVRAQESPEIEHCSIRAGGHLGLATDKDAALARVVVGGGVTLIACDSSGFQKALLEAAGLAAVAVGFDELEAMAARLEPIRSGRIPFVCANVVDENTGKTVLAGHATVTIGKIRVAFVGVTRPTRKRTPPKGWRLDEPAAVLKTLVPALAKEADRIVVLAVMDRLDAAGLLKEVAGIAAVIVPAQGVNDPKALRVGEGWLVQSPDSERVIGRLSPSAGKNDFARVEISDKDFKRLSELAAKHGGGSEKFVSARKPAGGVEEGSAASFEPGKRRAVWVEGSNRALEVRAHSFLVASEFGGRKAADGRAWLVVDSEWTNAIPMRYVYEREAPVAFHIVDFREILYVVVNGSRLARLEPELTSAPGGLTEKDFWLPNLGSSRRGVAVFDVPAAGIETLDFRFYDLTHGHIALALLARKEAGPAAKPVAGPAKNQLLGAEVRGVRKVKKGAPDGMSFVHVDLLAHGVWSIETDATAFNPKAKKGEKMRVPTFGRWEDLHRLVSLVVDGESAASPLEASLLPNEAMLLPDVATGNELVFLAPDSAKSLEVRLDFVPMGVPGRADPLLPVTLTLPIEGARPKAADRKSLVSAKDGEVRIDVIAKSVEKGFAGREGRFLVVDLRVLNGGEGAFFDANESVKYVPEQGDPVGLHEAAHLGPRPPLRFLPKGERRVFQAVFEIDAKATRHRVRFGEQVLELP